MTTHAIMSSRLTSLIAYSLKYGTKMCIIIYMLFIPQLHVSTQGFYQSQIQYQNNKYIVCFFKITNLELNLQQDWRLYLGASHTAKVGCKVYAMAFNKNYFG